MVSKVERQVRGGVARRNRRGPVAFALACALAAGCGGSARYPLEAPLARDPDDRPFSPAPEDYESPFAWDALNQTMFRPMARFFAVDPAGRAVNANALDEVADSSWFTARLGRRPVSPEDVTRGSCSDAVLDPGMPDGSWVIDKGKDNGANPGFRVNIPGVGKFMLKSDGAGEPERATGATAIASRIYHAVGYFAPCDTIVYFRPAILKLTPGLTITNNEGATRQFDQADLEKMLGNASHRDGLVRMVASEWLPGRPLGPYTYEGRRGDDPNDIVAHEDRRELRGGRLVAAWLNHFDSREQNTMDVFLPADPKKKNGPGHVQHYIIDLGDSFGSVWAVDAFSRMFDHAYMFDVPYIAEDFITFGAIVRPWERAERTGGVFNYYTARGFDPELWRGEYPNPAFGRMTEEDGSWMARILARFSDTLVSAAVRVGTFDDPSTQYLTETLRLRRQAILRRYLARLSSIGEVHLEGNRLCGTDLGRFSGVFPRETRTFRARLFTGEDATLVGALETHATGEGRICVELPNASTDGGPALSDPSRYRVVDIANGYCRGVLRAHLYDLGPRRGFRLVGVERPGSMEPPG